MSKVRLEADSVRIGRHFSVSFQRTLRIPDDGSEYPLPPGLGRFPVLRVDDYRDRVPGTWREHGGVFIPMYQREALWISFGYCWPPTAVKVGVGKISAVSGKPWAEKLDTEEQDYLVCPDQPWLDGINAGNGYIRQFVAMPLGMGYTVEGQLSGKEEFGGIQIVAFPAKPGRFPPRARFVPPLGADYQFQACATGLEMGLAAGGKMTQKIYPDDYGPDTWDQSRSGRVHVHICNSMMFREITGLEPPSTPITAKTYNRYGLPWFELYDEAEGDVDSPETLAGVKSTSEIDGENGFMPQQDDSELDISKAQVVRVKKSPHTARDGS